MSGLEVVAAPVFATVQDLGRFGYRAQGVPPSGAMDPDALVRANDAVGNDPGDAGLEWALGPGRLRALAACHIAVDAVRIRVTVDGHRVPLRTGTRVDAGEEIALGVPEAGWFAYLAIAGGLDVPLVLGSRSTYLPGRFGGMEGRRIRTGDTLSGGSPEGRAAGPASTAAPTRGYDEPIRVVPGPQADLFDTPAWEALLSGAYVVGSASDRMGYRLEGPSLAHRGPATLPSEPACPGAIQVPDGGAPIVLMPDGPTVGGYPKLAVVVTADLGRMAQRRPGDPVRFERVGL